MPNEIKTPGVYVVEQSMPAEVVAVPTAVPAFIGYTEKAEANVKSLQNKPWRITSMSEFHQYFGMGPPLSFAIGVQKTEDSLQHPAVTQDGVDYYLTRSTQRFNLYNCMRTFFANGGGNCVIVSVGGYENTVPDATTLIAGLNTLEKEQVPTLVVIPDAVLLNADNCAEVQVASLKHCGKLQNRFAILDVHNGFQDRAIEPDCIDTFRNNIGDEDLQYGAAYYPWIETSVFSDLDFSYLNIDADSRATLQEIISIELGIGDSPEGNAKPQADLISKLDGNAWTEDEQSVLEASQHQLHKSLSMLSAHYTSILKRIRNEVNLLPPSAALAGVYTMVDNTRGVWKAPANVSLNNVDKPAINVSHDEQEDLNVSVDGKSINAIRTFVGEGVLVWGARTLDGNSLDWRYINVRRTVIMLEESIRCAVKAYVFESNDANTWTLIKSMANSFLTDIWRQGALAGTKPDDAFSVQVGLGSTMTADDITEGILRVTIWVALVRPAEFIQISFQQKMQQS